MCAGLFQLVLKLLDFRLQFLYLLSPVTTLLAFDLHYFSFIERSTPYSYSLILSLLLLCPLQVLDFYVFLFDGSLQVADSLIHNFLRLSPRPLELLFHEPHLS